MVVGEGHGGRVFHGIRGVYSEVPRLFERRRDRFESFQLLFQWVRLRGLAVTLFLLFVRFLRGYV